MRDIKQKQQKENIMRKVKTKIHIPADLTGSIDKYYVPVLEDLRKAFYNDRMLSRFVDSGNIVIHSSLGYPVAKYKNTGVSIGIEPLNLMIRQDLSLGYIVVVRSGNDSSQEVSGDLHRALPKAIELFKYFYHIIKNKMVNTILTSNYHCL